MSYTNIEPSAKIYNPGVMLTIIDKGQAPKTVYAGQANFKMVVEAFKKGQWNKVRSLMDVSKAVQSFGKGTTVVRDGVVYVNGNAVHNVLTQRIVTMMTEGFDVNPMLRFLENLEKNPSMTAREELYLFLEANAIPLTTDGHFLAYKKVNREYMDHFTRTFRNKIGDVCQMDRTQVDDNRDRTCSKGLHFCSYSYLASYAGTDDSRVMIVKINPADVVSIPSDYNNAKGRCWKYTVVQEHETFTDGEWFVASVYDDLGNEVDEEDRFNLEEALDERDYKGYNDPAEAHYHNKRDAWGRFTN